MATQSEINAAKAVVDTDITNQTAESSVTAAAVGNNIKEAMDLTLSPYRSYVAQISQSGTSAPTVVQLFENGFGGTPVWARTGVGTYTLTITGAFVVNKTMSLPKEICIISSVPDELAQNVSLYRVSANVFSVDTFSNGAASDDILNTFPFEIRVYN